MTSFALLVKHISTHFSALVNNLFHESHHPHNIKTMGRKEEVEAELHAGCLLPGLLYLLVLEQQQLVVLDLEGALLKLVPLEELGRLLSTLQ